MTSNRNGRAHRAAWFLCFALWGLLLARPASAQPISTDDVPPDLAPWIPWALDGAGDEGCTLVDATPTCVWPGRLSLDATASGVKLSFDVFVERRARVTLPGGTDLWPEDVRVGATAAIVTEVDGAPQIWLPPGTHTIEGFIAWKTRPDLLAVPANAGRVSLQLDGKPARARWESAGKLWLTADGGNGAPVDPAAKEQERIEMEVFRRIEDGVPVVVTTVIDLRVSGPAREVRLGSPVLRGGVLLAVTPNGLPIRLEGRSDIEPTKSVGGEQTLADSEMVVGVRAGKHRIELRERHMTPPVELLLEKRTAPWPDDEIWAFQPALEQRQVELSGLPSVDPARTNAPPEWRSLQVFKGRAPATLAMKTARRGNPAPPPNKLKLSRQIWLDDSLSGYTVVDKIDGTMNRDYRLDFLGPGELGNATLRFAGDQLISVREANGPPGVELRNGDVAMMAEWRSTEPLREMPAVGWSTEVDELSVTVHLPPGWELLHATGAGEVHSALTESFELVDLAIILAIALAMGKVMGVRCGVVAALAMLLLPHSSHGLRWWVLAVVVFVAIARAVAADGLVARWSRLTMRGSALIVAWLVLGLVATEAQLALWPQSEAQRWIDDRESALESKATEAAASYADNKEGGTGTRAKGEEGSMGNPVSKASGVRYGVAGPRETEVPAGWTAQRSADDIVQTGHGVPEWDLRAAALTFSGTIHPARMLRFYLVTPFENAMVALARCALSIAVAWLLLRATFRKDGIRPSPRGAPYRAAIVTSLVLFATLLVSSSARAETPSAEMLGELRGRLTRAPACAPACASVSSMRVEAKGERLTIILDVHAEATSAVVLPSGGDGWVPTRIDVDGKRAVALRTQDGAADAQKGTPGGALLLRLSRGTHEVELEGPITSTGLSLALGTRPHRIVANATGWSVEGMNDEGAPIGATIDLRKTGAVKAEAAPKKTSGETTGALLAVTPFLHVTRTIELGVTWTVTTIVKRVSPGSPPVTASIPILEGEKVVEGGARMEGRTVTVDLGRDTEQAKFVSAVTPRDELVLQATETNPWSETWVIRCSAIWQCRSEGISPIEQRADGMLQATFRPWPGEKVTVHAFKPHAAKGASTTLDKAQLRLSPGESMTDATLTVVARSSTGGTQTITLPEGVQVTQLTINGAAQPSSGEAQLRVPIAPGSSVIKVDFKLAGGRGLWYRAPAVDVGGEVVNGHVDIIESGNRTILWLGGASWGPVVLVWPYLLLLAAIGIVLGRIPNGPLTTRQWLLLAPGLTQVPALVAAVLFAWFFVVHHRRDRAKSSTLLDAIKQIAIATFTCVTALAVAISVYLGATGWRTRVLRETWQSTNGESPGYDELAWYADRGGSALARPWTVSVPNWVWSALVLAWAAAALTMVWPIVKAAWARFSDGGVFRRPTVVAAPMHAAYAAPHGVATAAQSSMSQPQPAPEPPSTPTPPSSPPEPPAKQED